MARPNRPWVVRFVLPGGSANLAGVKAGNPILQLGGRAATLDISAFEAVTEQAPGTMVSAVLLRAGEEEKVTLRLVRLLAR